MSGSIRQSTRVATRNTATKSANNVVGTQRENNHTSDKSTSASIWKAKRRRVAQTSEAPEEQDTCTRKTIADLPAELIYKIAENLRPGELVNFCDTSPWIWHTLCNNRTVFIWKNSREREEVSEIPSGMNEYYWAKLFFGTRCMECGKDQVDIAAVVDFRIRRRLCKLCKKEKYVRLCPLNSEKFGIALSLCTTTDLGLDGTRKSGNFYSLGDDIVEQSRELARLRIGADAEQRVANYIESRKAQLRKMLGEIEHLIELHDDYLETVKAERGNKYALRYKEVVKRFKDLGYRLEDFPSGMKMHKLVRRKTTLIDEDWNKIRAALEPTIRAEAIEHEVTVKLSRRLTVNKLYAQYKHDHVPPTEWNNMPKVYNVCRLPHFAALVNADRDRTIPSTDFAACVNDLGQSLTSAYEQTRTRLRARVLGANDPFFDSGVVQTRQFKDLELATIVFRCTRCNRGVFGWDDIRSHACERDDELGLFAIRDPQTNLLVDSAEQWNEEFPHTYQYSERGSVAMRKVIESLELNPKTTTISQLDARPDIRLECHCSGSDMRYAYKWRMLAWHLADHADLDHIHAKLPKGKVPDVCLPDIIQAEFHKVIKPKGRFSCTHCSLYLYTGLSERMKLVEMHLRKRHSIDHPQINVDYIMVVNTHWEYSYFESGIPFDHTD